LAYSPGTPSLARERRLRPPTAHDETNSFKLPRKLPFEEVKDRPRGSRGETVQDPANSALNPTARSIADSGPVPAEERREHPRYKLRLTITMRGENNFYSGLSENLSAAGVFIATQHVLPLGTSVVMSFTLPSSDEPITVVGRVRWVRGADANAKEGNCFGDASGDVKPGIGVQFCGLDDTAMRAIRRFMNLRSPDFYDD
jgi:uncharacterized protein (TIGR02266 family)